MLVQAPAGATVADLTAALQAVIDRHDALGCASRRDVPPVWRTAVTAPGTVDAAALLRRVDVADLDDEARRRA